MVAQIQVICTCVNDVIVLMMEIQGHNLLMDMPAITEMHTAFADVLWASREAPSPERFTLVIIAKLWPFTAIRMRTQFSGLVDPRAIIAVWGLRQPPRIMRHTLKKGLIGGIADRGQVCG